MIKERLRALIESVPDDVFIDHLSAPLPQDPESPGFRELWKGIMIGAGVQEGDYLVTSESYGKWLAESCSMKWMPYNIDRDINPARGSSIRDFPYAHWNWIIPEFQRYLQYKVTIFGAESTGKTSLANELNKVTFRGSSIMLPEYARPYLENTGKGVTDESMTAIWYGQRALQRQFFPRRPLVLQDTDLHSTQGYWDYWCRTTTSFEQYAGTRLDQAPPLGLLRDAKELQSDLYLITGDDIPFVPDPLRYGGDHREIRHYEWCNYAAAKKLPFIILDCDPEDRAKVAEEHIRLGMKEKAKLISYNRKGF